MIALATFGAAAITATVLLAIGIVRAARSTRTIVRTLVAQGHATRPIAQQTRLSQDVVTIIEYRIRPRTAVARQFVPTAAGTAANKATKGSSGPSKLAS